MLRDGSPTESVAVLHLRPVLFASVACLALGLVNLGPAGLGTGAALAKNDQAVNGKGRPATVVTANAKGKSASAPGHNKPNVKLPSTTDDLATKGAKTPGLDAQLASLHAANANLQAFKNASPNSKVGQIAAYARAKVGAENAVAIRDATQTALGTATTAKAAAQSAYDASTAVLRNRYGYADTSVAALQVKRMALTNALATTTDLTRRAALQSELAAVDTALSDSSRLASAQLAVDRAAATLVTAERNLGNAQTAADTALNLAANDNRTPVDPAAKAWVDAQLESGGVFDYYRSLPISGSAQLFP
jgi:hypothetical protein